MFREAQQKSGQQFTPDDIERTLHNFVSDVAMLSLETDEAKLQKEAVLYARHLNYVSALFNHIFVSNTWSKTNGAFYTRLLLSPMTDSIDVSLRVMMNWLMMLGIIVRMACGRMMRRMAMA